MVMKAPSTNVLVEDTTVRQGNGLVIGTADDDAVHLFRNITFRRCTAAGTAFACHIKFKGSQSGIVNDVRFEDITVQAPVHYAIGINQDGPSSALSTRRYPFVWRKGVLNGYSSTRVAVGFANVRASRYGIRSCSGGYSSTNAGAGAGQSTTTTATKPELVWRKQLLSSNVSINNVSFVDIHGWAPVAGRFSCNPGALQCRARMRNTRGVRE